MRIQGLTRAAVKSNLLSLPAIGIATGMRSSATAAKKARAAGAKTAGGIPWQITPRVLMDALAAGGAEAERAFAAMMEMGKIDIAKIEAARRG